MIAAFRETNTPASRVLYINSKDATRTFSGNSSDFDFVLEEPVVVPDHHYILLSVFSAEITYSFYNFVDGRNTRLDYVVTPHGTPASYDANGNITGFSTLTLPQGNYNALQLSSYIENNLNDPANPAVFPLKVRFDPISMKFKFAASVANHRITLALKNGVATGTKEKPGDDMNEELGFDFDGILGDPFVELNAAGNGWSYGYTNANPLGAGLGVDTGVPAGAPFSVETFLFSDDVVDLTNSIRSLFIRTNLSSTSVLDSHIGGGFSNILTRVPINAEPQGIITIQPTNGDVHKLLLKIKAITTVSIRLTDQTNRTVNLNGLNFDISSKLEFAEFADIKVPKTLRTQLEEARVEREEKLKLEDDKKKKKKSN